MDTRNAVLLLETGVSQRWQYATYRKTAQTTAEAEEWAACKAGVGGVHFLAVQPGPDSDTVTGFWMLQDKPFAF